MRRSPTVPWTREHLLVALNLYRKIPFGKVTHRNPLIIEVASKLGRSPSSLSMKLGNLASFDPVLKARGIKGFTGASKQDREVWEEFQANLSELGPESEQLLHDLFTRDPDEEVGFLDPIRVRIERSRLRSEPTERTATVKLRRGQQFFRQSILNAFGVRCCVSGIDHPRLLIASHIKPWRDFPDERLDPRNGLCLSSLHDAAFDSGLITVDEDLKLVVSKDLRTMYEKHAFYANFGIYEGSKIHLPAKVAEPSREFLAYHREKIFCV